MKDSGIEWIGEIPTDWELCKLKRLIKRVVGGIWGDEAQGDSNDVPCVRVIDFDRNNFKVKNVGFTVINLDKDRQRQYLLRQGDLLIEKSGGGEQQPVGFVVQYDLDMPAIYTNFIAKMEMNNYLTNSNFLKYIFATLYFQGINTRSIKQTTGIQNIDIDSYMDEIIALPPLTEQQRIANYLDQKVAQVDYIIKKTKEYIEEYKKYKQSLITEVVTKGLNPNIEMKDSGIEWIGEIPENWEMPKVKHLFYIGRGRVIAQTELEEGGLYPVYSSQTKDDGCLGYINTYDFDKPQLTWTTDGANAGTVFLRKGKYNCTNVCGTLLLKSNNNDLRYLKYALEYIAKYHKRPDTNGYKIMNNEMAEIKITLPPNKEQQQIADYLTKKCSEIDKIISQKEQIISELESYKKSLIYEYVTGKKRVI